MQDVELVAMAVEEDDPVNCKLRAPAVFALITGPGGPRPDLVHGRHTRTSFFLYQLAWPFIQQTTLCGQLDTTSL